MSQELVHAELSKVTIGAAMKVLNALKPGLDEKAYENALLIDLTKQGHRVEQQKPAEVRFKGQLVDKLIPDLIVDDLVIVAPKTVDSFSESHIAK